MQEKWSAHESPFFAHIPGHRIVAHSSLLFQPVFTADHPAEGVGGEVLFVPAGQFCPDRGLYDIVGRGYPQDISSALKINVGLASNSVNKKSIYGIQPA